MATIPTPHGGLLIITLPNQGATGILSSQYFDRMAPHGKIRDALYEWMNIWGIKVSTSQRQYGDLEANTQEVVWCEDVPKSLHGPQTVPYFAEHGEHVLNVLEAQSPRLIIVFSGYLYEALKSPVMASKVTAIIGRAKTPARRITTERLKALHQSFERCELLGLPTPSKNTTKAYVETLTMAVRQAFQTAGFSPSEKVDDLLMQARGMLVLDERKTLEKWERQFAIDRQRAQQLLDALEEEGRISAPDEKGRRYLNLDR